MKLLYILFCYSNAAESNFVDVQSKTNMDNWKIVNDDNGGRSKSNFRKHRRM